MGAYVQLRPPQKGDICAFSLTASGAFLFTLEGLASGRDWWWGHPWMDSRVPHTPAGRVRRSLHLWLAGCIW